MNSSVLVSGFVVVGVGAMAILFNPFGSSADTSATPASTYQASATSKKVSAPSPVSASVTDPEPFVWANKKETATSKKLIESSNNQSAAKKVAKSTKPKTKEQRPRGLGSKAFNSASQDSAQKLQTVSKTDANFSDQTVSTADADLNSFFGKSKPAKSVPARKPASKVAKAPKTKSKVAKIKSEPVRVASKPTRVSAKPESSRSTPKVETSLDKTTDMFSFSPRGGERFGDAPTMAPPKSKDFDMPKIEPVKETKMVSKAKPSSQNFSGSFDSVMDKPSIASHVVKEFNIKNPLQTRLAVTFLIDGKKVSLKPGQHFVIRQTEDVRVKFSRGGSFGYSEEQLSEGKYEFSVTRKDGWKLAQ